MVVFIPIVLLFRVMIEIIDSITSSPPSVFSEEKFKYKNPLGFEERYRIRKSNQLQEPITLCEGVFDDEYQTKLFLFWVNLFQKL